MNKKEYKELMAKSTEDIRNETKEKAARYRDIWAELSRNLYRIKVAEDYRGWGFASFEEYVADELGLEARTVLYWLSIYDKLVLNLGISEEKLKGKAWSKLRYIVPVVNRKNVAKWMERAETMTQGQIHTAVQASQSGKEIDDSKPTPESFKLAVTPEEKKTIEAAMTSISKIADGKSPGHQLAMICMHFESDHFEARRDLYVKVISRIEKLFDVKLLTVDRRSENWKEQFERARDAMRELVKA